ncbi:MAG: mevalonate kinase [Chloroflexi bacterium]|nr:mevalonate kinase [Chloroflexota bacterium]
MNTPGAEYVASAPGKVILFGEHAVVYARPAVAVPVFQVRAQAAVRRLVGRVQIDAADIGQNLDLQHAAGDNPIAAIIHKTCARLGVAPADLRVQVRSTIPVARGLGSGAAVSVAVARALAGYYAIELSNEEISGLAYQVELLHHGTPSGIDNTVIARGEPVYFIKGRPIESFRVARPFVVVIADTGVAAPTKVAVGDVRRAWENDTERFERLFDQIGAIASEGRTAIERGDVDALGPLMNANQALAREIGVSSPKIEALVDAARAAGAAGAKLSGAGRGGNVIALVNEGNRERVEEALKNAGAVRLIATRIESN